jgi:hypothetical protein
MMRSLVARFILILFVCLLLGVLQVEAAPPFLPSSQQPTAGLIVQLKDGASAGPDWRPVYGMPGRYTVPAASTSAIQSIDIEWSEANPIVTVDLPKGGDGPGLIARTEVNDPLADQQYSLDRMGVPAAWQVSQGNGVLIAILDTGRL